MRKQHKLALAVAALCCNVAAAQQVTGKIVDEQGQPVANAQVSLAGSNTDFKTAADGSFSLQLNRFGVIELHAEAEQFVHKNWRLDVPAEGLNGLVLTLPATALEVIDIKASPFHASVVESAMPVTVLSGEKLKMNQAATLGDTLKNEVGVHSNFYGSVASSPIIRGLDGPRVLITQNGLDAGDASRVGPDHSVSAEASTAEQIEVLRGPATLFYGSGAIGGVVNVVDQRIPTTDETKASYLLQRESVNNEKLVSAAGQSAVGAVAFYADAFWRENDSYKIPGTAEVSPEAGEEQTGRVENTQGEAQGYTLGSSYLLDNGYVGLSFGRLERQYGIPGHHHGEEGDEAEEDESAEAVYADMTQNRVQLLSELHFDHSWISGLNSRIGYTDYQHAEIEGDTVGTTFKNQSEEARFELLHREWLNWKGGLSLHYKHSDFEAVGEEAFTPPSESQSLALGWIEERHFGAVLLQLGARVEQVKISASDVLLPPLSAHSHEGDDHGYGGNAIRVFDAEHKFEPSSLSAGLVWDFTDGYNLGVSLSHSERAPSAAELLSFGPHIGTQSYEVGALFIRNPDAEGEAAFVLNPNPIEVETANNLDLTLRKISGDFGFVLNAFYNQVDNYYYQANTGLFAESGHSHEHEGEEHEEHNDELPVYLFQPADALLHGFEAQLVWKLAPQWTWTNQADYIRARLKEGGDLPRTPPLRFSTELAYQGQWFSSDVRLTHYGKQDKLEALETASASYTVLDANLNYYFDWAGQDMAFYVKGSNLTDREARVHSSFLKDLAPLPGRSIGVGIRGEF
ncbi:TonB-dependent receptor [Rheinheimera sp.]|uniref:TonB-dependent receptor n=1 Tax=Rheinheimera sp. TaxID=1869214 RepID=UPI00307CDA87